MQPIEMKLFLIVRGSNHVHLGPFVIWFTVPIQPDDGAYPFVDLSLKGVPGRLNLTSLIPSLDSSDNATLLFDLPEFLKNCLFHRVTDCLHSRRTGQGVHHMLKQAALFQQNRLGMCRVPSV